MKVRKTCLINTEGFLFNVTSGESYTFNPMALQLLSLLKDNCTVETLYQFVKDNYDVDDVTLQTDVDDFLFMLEKKGLLEK